MKKMIFILICFLAINTQGQVIGNKKIKAVEYPLNDIIKINVQMYARVYIDIDEEPGIIITGESNLLDFIQKEIKNGELVLDQKKWIEPTQDIIIKIGAPRLQELEIGTHDKVIVSNINGSIFKVDAPIGEVILEGQVEELWVNSKKSKVDASKLISKTADININGDGEVIVNASLKVDCNLNEDARFTNVNRNNESIDCGGGRRNIVERNEENRFIDLKIKNNSLRRNHFVVVGPKPDGRKFSYGFPLMPFQSKKERWTVGTKVYKENAIGLRTFLVTLSEEDENQTVKLFR